MIAHPKTFADVGLLLAIAFAECQSMASDAAVNWHFIGDGPPVTVFALTPTNPTTQSVITFVAPTEGSNYVNGCYASLYNGYPKIAVNTATRAIDVTFSGRPSACSYVALPVSGLEGRLGPLPAGFWSISVPSRFPGLPTVYSLTVEFVPPPLSLQATVGASSFTLSWPASGELYALQSTRDLVSANWQVVTNSPTLSSNTYTLQISADSGSRFFRLHHL